MEDTIVAISTSLGVGAISIIRISGNDAEKIVNQIFSNDLKTKKSHTINYGKIIYKNEIIDEVLVSIMRAPKTFTKEDVIEINCHGGISTTKKVLEILIEKGCRLAEPGEFTKRAFLNGRIDLTEAEAIIELINTKTDKARKIAIKNLNGDTKDKIKQIRQNILKVMVNIEANIDYPEYQDIEVITTKQIKELIKNLQNETSKIIKNSKNSKIITNGINIGLFGKPNVGKSSILNKLSGEDKAIVTEIAGTTRDIVEIQMNLEDVQINLIDTAGIRKTEDLVEKIGVEKSKKILNEVDLAIIILNNSEELEEEDKELLEITKNKKRIIVVNKNDLESKLKLNEDVLYINTIKEEGLDPLKNKIIELFNLNNLIQEDFSYVSNINSIKKIEEIYEKLKELEKNDEILIDLIEIDLKYIYDLLGEIIGEKYNDDILNNLFKTFCVGK